MYYVNKIVGFIVSPIGIAIMGGVIAWLCAKREHRCAAKWLGWLTVVWLWLWMTPLMTWVVGVPLEREFLVDGRVPMVESFPEADAIVLLGGSMGIETNLSSYAEMWGSADRVWQAARLYKAGKAPKVIATGDGARDSTLPLLKEFGVGEEAVSFLDARNTEDEAKGVEEEVKVKVKVKGGEEVIGRSGGVGSGGVEELGKSGGEGEFGMEELDSPTHPLTHSSTSRPKVLLVTSAWHMKRARLMFEKYAPDVEVVCAPADFENSIMAKRSFTMRSLAPDFNAFTLNSVAFHEWIGIAGYKFLR